MSDGPIVQRRGTPRFAQAVDTFRRAEFDQTLALIAGDQSTQASLLLARTLMKLGQISEAISCLRATETAGLDTESSAELRLLEGIALTRGRRGNSGYAVLNEAIELAKLSDCFELQLECDYYIALWHWTERNVGDAEETIEASLRFAHNSRLQGDPTYIYTPSMLVSRDLLLLALTHGSRGQYRAMAEFTIDALNRYDAGSKRDAHHEAVIVEALSVFMRDSSVQVGTPDSFLQRLADWPDSPYTLHQRFAIVRNVALAKAHANDNLGAARLQKTLASLAFSEVSRFVAAVDMGDLYYEINEPQKGTHELRSAIDRSRRCDWRNEPGSQDYLLYAARVAARICPEAARPMLDQFAEISGLSRGSDSPPDPRLEAEIVMTEGLVAKREGRAAEAIAHLRQAFDAWRTLDIFPVYEIETGLALAELTRDSRLLLALEPRISQKPPSRAVRDFTRLRKQLGASTSP